MTPTHMKYATILCLDRIALILDTFQTPDIPSDRYSGVTVSPLFPPSKKPLYVPTSPSPGKS
jgi:hypothetical protein